MLFNKKKSTLFNDDIDASCLICEHGHPAPDGSNRIFCNKCGPVDAFYHCSKFCYAPLKRVPRRQPNLPSYKKEDFIL